MYTDITESATTTITPRADVPDDINISPSTKSIGYSGGSFSVSATCGNDVEGTNYWSVITSSGCSISATNNSHHDYSGTVTVYANSGEARTLWVSFDHGSGASGTLYITQDAAPASISANPTSKAVSYAGESFSITYTTIGDGTLSVSSDQSWATVSGSGNSRTISVSANSSSQRTATITASFGGKSTTTTITQYAYGISSTTMAWDSSKVATKILTIGEMNAAKPYNIFPNVTNSSTDWNRCPTKSELKSTSVVSGGYTYTVTISNDSSFSSNQLVPNNNLNVKSVANNYTIFVHCLVNFTNPPTTGFARENWNYEGLGVCHWATDAIVTINCGTDGANSYSSIDTIAEIYGDITAGPEWNTYLENCYADVSVDFSVPLDIDIYSITVELMNDADATIYYNLNTSEIGKTVNLNFSGNGYLYHSDR